MVVLKRVREKFCGVGLGGTSCAYGEDKEATKRMTAKGDGRELQQCAMLIKT